MTDHLYVKHVKSNAKTGVDVELGPKTLIVGPNKSGKSAIINAVEIALSGRASDVGWVADEGEEHDLLSLAPGRDKLEVEATLSDGSKATWVASNKKGEKNAKRETPASVDPRNVFPIRLLKDAFSGKADRARKFILEKACGALSVTSVVERFPKPLQPLVERLIPARLQDAVQALFEVQAAAEAQARELKKVIKHSNAAIETTQPGETMPAEEDIVALRKHVDTLRARQMEAAKSQAAFQHAQATAVKIAEVEAQLATSRANLLALDEHLQGKSVSDDGTLIAAARAIIEIATYGVKHAATICPVCARAEATPGSLAGEVFPRVIEQAKAGIEAYNEVNRDLRAVMEHRESLAEGIRRGQGLLDALRANYAPVAAAEPVDALALAAEADAAEARLTKLMTTAGAWQQLRMIKDKVAAQEGEVDKLERVSTEAKKIIKEMLTERVASFEARVQKRLPAGAGTFRVKLNEGKREVCHVGLEKGDQFHTAFSGAEGVQMTLALAAECAVLDPVKLTVFVPDDRGFDPDTLAATLAATTSFPGQVIIATPTIPSQVPAGWTVINLGPQAASYGHGSLLTLGGAS